MFINKTNIKLLVAALMTALSAPSCMNLDETQDTGYGYLTISGLDLDVQVEQLVPTKAESVTLASLGVNAAPDVTNAVFTLVKDSESQTVQPNTELKLQAGTYTLNITYNNQGADGFGEALFGNASYPVTITAGQNTPLEYSLPLANSVMLVINDMGDHVDSSKPITISSSEVSGEVEAAFGSYVFVPSGKSLVVSGTNAAEAVFSYNLGPLDGGKAYNVKLTPSGLPKLELSGTQMLLGTTLIILTPATISSGSANPESIVYEATTDAEWNTANMKSSTVQNGIHVIEGLAAGSNYKVRARIGAIVSAPVEITHISVSADHSYTNGLLDGTDLKISNVPEDLKEKITFTLEKGGTTYRRDVKDSGEIDSDGSTDQSWPYLPHGLYTLKSIVNDNVLATINVDVSTPEFTVTTRPVSSYTYYADDMNVDEANNSGIGGSAIWIETKVGIADNIITNNNYTINLSGEFSTNTDKSGKLQSQTIKESNIYNHKPTELTSLNWQEHKVTIKSNVSFDGKEITATVSESSCHVTGLPYSISFEGNTSPQGWNFNNTAVNDNMLCLKITESYALSPKFIIPENKYVNINALVNAYAYSGSVWLGWHMYVKIKASETAQNDGFQYELDNTLTYAPDATFHDLETAVQLSSSCSRVSFYMTGKKPTWTVTTGGRSVGVVCKLASFTYVN